MAMKYELQYERVRMDSKPRKKFKIGDRDWRSLPRRVGTANDKDNNNTGKINELFRVKWS